MTMTKRFNEVQSESQKEAAEMKKTVSMMTSHSASGACFAQADFAASMKMESVGVLGTAAEAVSFLSGILLEAAALAVRIMLPWQAKP